MVEIEEPEDPSGEQGASFAEIVRTYRWLLSQPGLSPAERKARNSLGRELYSLLLQPLGDRLKDKDELIIVPDGVLGFLPFETLIMPDGKYLVESYNIRYLPSLTVSSQLKQRRHRAEPIVSAQALEHFKARARATLQEKLGTRDAYATLGLTSWQDLPGTLTEVREIGLGKIYGGEGMVGLTQAFLLAGANGLSVSLWQVADESTRKFMVGLYELAQSEGFTYQRALNEPFYWAPFMYYGR